MFKKIESLGTSTGKIIYSCDDFQDILRLSVAETMELFKSSGVLLFRGFQVTHEQMKTFAELFSCKFIQDYARPQVDSDKFVHFVDPGMDASSVHSEHAYTPFRPDVIWFCCALPAAEGGETTFCDGVRVWEELSEETRQLFLSKKVKFSFEAIPADILNKFAGNADATTTDIKQMLDGLDGVKYQFKEDGSIWMEYICSTVVKTKDFPYNAFANSILGYHQENRKITFEDNSIVPDEVLDEIVKVTDELMQKIPWEAGDLAMIDNSRFMHDRKEFNDHRRQVFSILSNLKF